LRKLIRDRQKLLTSLLKWGIFVLSILFIYRELFHQRNATELFYQYGNRCLENIEYLIAACLLMPLNWFLESYKWKRLMHPEVLLKPLKALRATFAGVAVSILTPNRVGEFAGRMLFIPLDKRNIAITMSLAGSIAQLMVTLILGGLFAGIHAYQLELLQIWHIILGVGVLSICMWLYLSIDKADVILKKWKNNSFVQQAKEALGQLNNAKLLEALIWSAMRYIVFSLQLGLLIFGLVELNPSFNPLSLIIIVPIYFLAQTIIPTIALSEIGVRGMILATMFTENAPGSDLLMTSTLLWLINIVGPALFGGTALLTQKFRLYK